MSLLRLVLALGCFALVAEARRPNILIILCDDLGYSDLGCYGSEIRTPNLDALARDGVRFTQFHNTSKCWTTRATLLTGRYWQAAAPNKFIKATVPTIPELLRDAGYRTFMSGKWHLSPGHYKVREHLPAARGFVNYFGTLHGATSFYDPFTLTRGFEPIRAPRDGKFYYTDAISDDATGNLREHSRNHADQPFFMYVAYTAPHWPMHALPEDIARYRGVYDEGWQGLREKRFAEMKRLGVIPANATLTPPNAKAKDWDQVDRDWEASRMEVYAAMIDRMDQGIGRIVKALRETGQLEDTLILFMSDNGASPENIGTRNGVGCLGGAAQTREGEAIQVGYGPGVKPGPEATFQGYGPSWANASCTPFLWWKATSHEGGVATPFIAHWPKGIRERGAINTRDFAHLIDLLPTCLAAANVKPTVPMDGVSLLPTLRENQAVPARAVFNEFGNKGFMREGDWKITSSNVKKGQWQLFNLGDDPVELKDVSGKERQRFTRMKQAFTEWRERLRAGR